MNALLSETTLQATEESGMGDILQQLKQILLQLPAKQVTRKSLQRQAGMGLLLRPVANATVQCMLPCAI